MASGDPVTSSLTASQKQLPAWDVACSFELLGHGPAKRKVKKLHYKIIGTPQLSKAASHSITFVASKAAGASIGGLLSKISLEK
jgi:hypothetical protein